MNNEINNPNINIIDDEISFLDVSRFFLRNKSVILIFTFIGMIFGVYYGISQKSVWKGSFQMLLQEEENNITSRTSEFFLGDRATSNTKTEIITVQK